MASKAGVGVARLLSVCRRLSSVILSYILRGDLNVTKGRSIPATAGLLVIVDISLTFCNRRKSIIRNKAKLT